MSTDVKDDVIIELKNLTKTYADNGFTAVSDFSLSVKNHQLFAVLSEMTRWYFQAHIS